MFGLVSSSWAQPEQDKVVDEIIAVVADRIILQSDLEEQYTQYARSGLPITPDSRCIIFEELLYQNLLINQSKIDSITVPDDQVEGEMNRRIEYFVQQIGSVEKMEEFYGKSIVQIKAEFKDLIRDQLLVQQMQGTISGDVTITPKEVREFYNSFPEDSLPFINAEVEVAQIVLEPQISEEEKDRVKTRLSGFRDRILKGEDFGTLAYLYSEDPGSANRNGELGFMTRGMLVPEFAAAMFSMEPGQISEIVETEFGFHLIQVIEKRGQQVNARHILLKPQVSNSDLLIAKQRLDSIRLAITSSDSIPFGDMASRHSSDESTNLNEGRMVNPATGTNKFEMDQMSQVDPGLFFVLDKMEPGDVSAPVIYQKPDGGKAYRLVKLISVSEPHRANLKQDYQRIQDAARAQKEQKIMDNWIESKITVNYIKIDDRFEDCTFQHKWF